MTEQAIAEGHESDNEGIEVQENAVQNASQSVVVQDDMDENVLSSETASTSGVGMLNQRMESTVEGLLEDENKVGMRIHSLKCQVFLKQALKWKIVIFIL